MKSVHLASTHRASDPRIFQKECRTLARAGIKVTYIVPHEQDEVVDGVQIRAVTMPSNGKERLSRTIWAIYRKALGEDAKAAFHLHDAELLPVGLLLKARGRTVIYDAHEDTPRQMLHQHWIPAPLRRLTGLGYAAVEALAGRAFDAIVAAVPDIARRYPADKTVLIRNYPRLDELATPSPMPHAERKPIVAYVGSITRARGIEEMMRAVDLVSEETEVELRLGGGFHPEGLAREIGGFPGASHTQTLGYLSRSDVASLFSNARVGIVTLHPTAMYEIAYPTKLFEYMSAGLPVVASDFALWNTFVHNADCGLTVDPLDSHAIAEAIKWLLEHPDEAEAMGRRGRRAVEEHYNWAGEGERLVELYHRLGTRQ